MAALEGEEQLIWSNNGDVRGRKGLVQQILQGGSDESIRRQIDGDTLWIFDKTKKSEKQTHDPRFGPEEPKNSPNPTSNGRNSNPVPITERSIKRCEQSKLSSAGDGLRDSSGSIWFRNDSYINGKEPEEMSTDFGYWEHKKVPPKTYSLNIKETPRVLKLPERYLNDSQRSSNHNSANQPITQSQRKASATTPLSRESSIRSYNKALPVGKYAKQKFRIVQDEDEYTDNPKIYDVTTNRQIANFDRTCDFDSINESVTIDIRDFESANVEIKIEEVKYSRRSVTDRIWAMKTAEVTRSVSIDLLKSGQGKIVKELVYEKMTHVDQTVSHQFQAYTVNVDEFQLSGLAAYTVYNVLMDIAENDESMNRGSTENNRARYTPRYLLAMLREEETIIVC